MKKIPIFGLPLNPLAALEELAGSSFCVSFANKRNVEDAIRLVGADGMLMVDNGAFSIYRAGGRTYDESMLEEFEAWAADILARCPHAVAVVPDVIGGTEAENLELIRLWWLDPERSMVVWHLNESLEHLTYLCEMGFAHVAFGSAGEFWKIGTPAWHARITEALAAIDRWVSEGEGAYVRPRVHMMRAMSMAHLYDFDSSDSTNVAKNHGRYRGAPGHVAKFAARVAGRITASADGEDAPHAIARPLLEHLEVGDARLYELATWFNDNYSIKRREPELPFGENFLPTCAGVMPAPYPR
jgi:hypothetical protein